MSSKIDFAESHFLLKDDDPEEPYSSSFAESKIKKVTFRDEYIKSKQKDSEYYQPESNFNTVKWGQRKLLMTELYLLLYEYPKLSIANPHLIYVGAAPGNHIPFLAKIFTEVTFHLYDKSEFEFEPLPNTIIYKEFFTDSHAYNWYSIRDRCIFVSDIRSPDFKKEGKYTKEMENFIVRDMSLQKKWIEIIRPKIFMLKFRLPYWIPESKYRKTKTQKQLKNTKDQKHKEELCRIQDNEIICNYLEGKIIKQPYTSPFSAETRLIGQKISFRDYSLSSYESKMFYHNKYTRRDFRFSNPVSKNRVIWYPELLDDYDSTYEIMILKKLLEKINEPVNEINIKKLSRSITIHLNEGKPMKEWKTLHTLRTMK